MSRDNAAGHVTLDTRPSCFSACNIEKLRDRAWGRGYIKNYSYVESNTLVKVKVRVPFLNFCNVCALSVEHPPHPYLSSTDLIIVRRELRDLEA